MAIYPIGSGNYCRRRTVPLSGRVIVAHGKYAAVFEVSAGWAGCDPSATCPQVAGMARSYRMTYGMGWPEFRHRAILYSITYKMVCNMRRINYGEDIKPLSEFRAGVSACLQQVTETKRPLIITQHGRGVAVLVDVIEFEAMQSRLELLEEVCKAESQLAKGDGIEHEEAKKRILTRPNTERSLTNTAEQRRRENQKLKGR